MSFLKVTWLRPVAALMVLAALALWLSAASPSSAGGPTADVTVNPADGEVGEGGTIDVDVVINPTGGSEVAVWIVKFDFDPAVIQPVPAGPGIDCSNFNVPQGVVGAGLCDAEDNDTAVALGGYIENVGGTAHGFDSSMTVSSFSFMAVGDAGAETDLTVTLATLLDPDGVELATTDNDGHISIIEIPGVQLVHGDVDCSGGASPVSVIDGRKVVLAVVGSPAAQPGGCPDIGDAVTIDGTARTFGDVDCSGGASPVSVIDGRKVVLAVVGSPAAQPGGCPDIGDEVTVVIP